MVYCIRMEKRNGVPLSLSLSLFLSVYSTACLHIQGIQYWWSPFFHKQFRPNNSLYSWWNVLANLKGNYTSLLSLGELARIRNDKLDIHILVKISLECKQFHFFFHRSSGFRIHFLIIIVLFLLLLPINNRHLFILRMILTNAFPIPNSKYKKSSKIENQFQFANTFFPSLLNISKIQHFSPIFLPI